MLNQEIPLHSDSFPSIILTVGVTEGVSKASIARRVEVERSEFYKLTTGKCTLGLMRFVRWLDLLGYEAVFIVRKKI